MDLGEYKRVAYGDWWKVLGDPEAVGREAHARNVERCREAAAEFRTGPLRVLAVHGSSRSDVHLSCAHELSNSQLLLRAGLAGLPTAGEGVEVEEVNLREYAVSPCNGCYSTTSALCGFPCNCFPLDPMQDLYPKFLRSEVLLMSTGVNQSAMSTRLKAVCDRLVSLDGGYYVAPGEFRLKDEAWKSRAVEKSLREPVAYDQRLQGRACAFFITSKDEAGTGGLDERGVPERSYAGAVAESLYRGFYDYGCEFADPWWVGWAAVPGEDLSYDKARLGASAEARAGAQRVARAAVARARLLRERPEARVPRSQPAGRT